jgi:hypothetical protein
MPIMDYVINALQRCVTNRQYPLFHTYLEFHERFGFRGLPNSWANRQVLDATAAWFKTNGSLDLTFLIHRAIQVLSMAGIQDNRLRTKRTGLERRHRR